MDVGVNLAIFGLPGGAEWIVILLAALLIFGRRLPDVARSIGRSIVEFKKGVRDVRDEIDNEPNSDGSRRLDYRRSDTPSHDAGHKQASPEEPAAPASTAPRADDA